MKRVLLVVLALVVIGGAGFGVYWRVTRFERTLQAAERKSAYSDEDWALLRTKPDDPRVIAAAGGMITRLPSDAGSWCEPGYQQLSGWIGPIVSAHPSKSDESVDSMGHFIAACGDLRAIKWVDRPASDVVVSIGKYVTWTRHDDDAVLKALEKLAPPVSPELIGLLVMMTPYEATSAEAHLLAGLPPSGKPFAALTDKGERLDPKTDPRIAQAVNAWVRSFYDSWPKPDTLRAMLRLSTRVRITVDEKVIQTLSRGVEFPELVPLARALIGPGEVELVKKYARADTQAVLLGPLAGSKEVQAVLDEVRRMFKDVSPGDPKIETTTDERAKGLVSLGQPATGTLRVGLSDDNWAVRNVSAKALSRIDRKTYAREEAKILRSKKGQPVDAFLAMNLLEEGPNELDPVFAAFSLGNEMTTTKATAFLKKHATPAQWVPALFENLAVGDEFSSGTVAAYGLLIAGAENVSFIAAALQAQLDGAHGVPDRVYWLTKHLALDALSTYGTKAERALVEKFVADRTSFDHITTRTKKGEPPKVETTRDYFSSVATAALAAIDARTQ